MIFRVSLSENSQNFPRGKSILIQRCYIDLQENSNPHEEVAIVDPKRSSDQGCWVGLVMYSDVFSVLFFG